MARFIIDDENISIDNLATLKKLGEKDKIYIVTNNRQKLSISVLAWFFARKIKIKIILLESAHKDYADKIITFLMGKLSHKKGKIYIVSNDKFYDDVIEFFNKQDKNGGKFYKLKFDFSRSQTAQLIEENQDQIAILIRNSGSLSELHMKFISKFGSKNGAGVYNALKEDARKIYKNSQNALLENPQKRDVKQIAALKSEKFPINNESGWREFNERERSQPGINLCDESALRAQNDATNRQNLENYSQNVQILRPGNPAPLESKKGSAADAGQILVKAQAANATERNLGGGNEAQEEQARSAERDLNGKSVFESGRAGDEAQNLNDEGCVFRAERLGGTDQNLIDQSDFEIKSAGDAEQKFGVESAAKELAVDNLQKNPQSKRQPQTQKAKQTASQNETKNKTKAGAKNGSENTAKTQSALKIDESKKQEIRKIAFDSKNLGDFHNGLVKKYGADAANKLYKALKQKAKEYLNKRAAKAKV